MATQVQFRKGTTTQNDAFTGALAEITVDTTKKALRVHDGATPGGSAIATEDYVNSHVGSDGVDGMDGDNAWSPVLSLVADGSRKVLQVSWIGGSGTAPSPNGYFVGASGYVSSIASAVTANVGREALTADRTYYVRGDGSDSNNGLANTSGGAFLTGQKAADVVWHTLDLAGHIVTIQFADGTYTAPIVVSGPPVGAITGASLLPPANAQEGRAPIVLKGNASAPANVLFNTSNSAISVTDGAFIEVRDIKLQSGAVGLHSIRAHISFVNIDFGACTGAHMQTQFGGYILAIGNYAISAGASHHMRSLNGFVVANAVTCTITGTPAFSTAFATAERMGYMSAQTVTYSGSATGVRFTVKDSSSIYTAGSTEASYFPGNAVGVKSNNGLYL